jgi:hypothetical protein
VPWENTSYVTYPNYPDFAPHSVLDFSTLDRPIIPQGFKYKTPIPFMEQFKELTGGWMRFSGGTPGMRLDDDR